MARSEWMAQKVNDMEGQVYWSIPMKPPTHLPPVLVEDWDRMYKEPLSCSERRDGLIDMPLQGRHDKPRKFVT